MKSDNSRVSSLWDQIAQIHAPSDLAKDADGLNDFLRKHHVVRGRIKGTAEVAKIAELGFQKEFQIDDVTYTTYQGIFEENTLPRASLSLCRELYAYILVFTESNPQFRVDFHKQVLRQFSEVWGKVESKLTFYFETLTEDLVRLESIFSHFDLAVALTAKNSDGDKFQIVIPGQQLVVYLSQKAGSAYNQELRLEK